MTPTQKKRIANVTAALEKMADIAPPTSKREGIETQLDDFTVELQDSVSSLLEQEVRKLNTRAQGMIGHPIKTWDPRHRRFITIVPETVKLKLVRTKSGISLNINLTDANGKSHTENAPYAILDY